MDYDYPGNIRELKNIIERLVILSDADGILKKGRYGRYCGSVFLRRD